MSSDWSLGGTICQETGAVQERKPWSSEGKTLGLLGDQVNLHFALPSSLSTSAALQQQFTVCIHRILSEAALTGYLLPLRNATSKHAGTFVFSSVNTFLFCDEYNTKNHLWCFKLMLHWWWELEFNWLFCVQSSYFYRKRRRILTSKQPSSVHHRSDISTWKPRSVTAN